MCSQSILILFYLDKVLIYSRQTRSPSCSVPRRHCPIVVPNCYHCIAGFCCLLAQMLWGFSIFRICSKWSAMVPRLTPVAFHMLLSVVVIRYSLFPQTDVHPLSMWTSSWQSTLSNAFFFLKNISVMFFVFLFWFLLQNVWVQMKPYCC